MTATATASTNAALSGDVRGLDALRGRAARDPQGAVREAARQFEALFMQELMKSLRATVGDGGVLDDGAGGELATSMLDQQYAGQLAGMRGGLAESIARQLERQMGIAGGAATLPPLHASTTSLRSLPPAAWPQGVGAAASARMPFGWQRPQPTGGVGDVGADAVAHPPRIPEQRAAFVQQHLAAARRAETQTGIPAAFMVAQAALESGWGRREIVHADGSPSHNLFGIKAGAGWDGPVAEVTTTEVEGGVARKVQARFRAYASHAESFADYARLLRGSPRYRELIGERSAEGFAQGLQRAGYATDPAYADKLGRTIDATLRLQQPQG
ncbi:MAG: flagellar assembly peptidoglycan hydrolase FlgJ [Rhodoferax sp.]|jgi:flagellar protein FlgJ|nr:flagellar assembly peptidoglycan hydrolase FlgJ [Rhodoferax sp.]MCL4737923.1 flagellar assembly peptidoglycan hydrolase FlgJ [Burkholderiaceae bacterium]MCP5288612.1 flagellar assembly peptidoglycan hydrolase FlgJ [Burkholderiaceae bacterium]